MALRRSSIVHIALPLVFIYKLLSLFYGYGYCSTAQCYSLCILKLYSKFGWFKVRSRSLHKFNRRTTLSKTTLVVHVQLPFSNLHTFNPSHLTRQVNNHHLAKKKNTPLFLSARFIPFDAWYGFNERMNR